MNRPPNLNELQQDLTESEQTKKMNRFQSTKNEIIRNRVTERISQLETELNRPLSLAEREIISAYPCGMRH